MDCFETPFNYTGIGLYGSIEPMQDRDEWEPFYKYLLDHDPDTILEIGSAKGGTLYPWCRPQTPPEKVVSVDFDYLDRELAFYEAFAYTGGTNLEVIKGDSHTQATKDAVEESFKGNVDYLFIDGDHSYSGVKQDFQMYQPLVADGGLIAFHDIQGDNQKCGVGKFWNEIKEEYPTETFIADPEHKMAGIGVLQV